MKARLRIPTVLAVAIFGCDGGKSIHDAAIAGDGCAVLCAPDGTDAGVCPDPFVCVSAEAPHVCPAGCMCSAYCFPRTPEGERNCPTDTGLQCASPERTCPAGCEAVG
jgi:hypothetical protein